MPIRFTIQSQDDVCDLNGLEIDEPVGWDAIGMRLKRDKTWRGFFDFLDDVVFGPLQFDFKTSPLAGGGQRLKELYELYGAEAEATLLIEFQCAELDPWDTLYTGRFVFSRYKYTCGDRCYVEIGVENTSCLMMFRNRYDQKVDLDSLAPFDDEGCESYDNYDQVTDAQFASPNVIHIQHIFVGIPPIGGQICIEGSEFNDGVYTIVSSSNPGGVWPLGGGTFFSIDGAVIDEVIDDIHVKFKICIPIPSSLTAYEGLGREISLPTKPLRFMNHWEMPSDYESQYIDDACPTFNFNQVRYYGISFNWEKLILSEIADNNPSEFIFYGHAFNGSLGFIYEVEAHDGILLYKGGALQCVTELRVQVKLEGTIDIESSDSLNSNTVKIQLVYGNEISGWNFIDLQSLGALGGVNTESWIISIDSDDTISIQPGDRVYLQLSIPGFFYTTGGGGGCPTDPFTLDMAFTEGRLKMTADSFCEPTVSKVYLINETLSHIAEAYTNDCLRVYSDLFGRTDAEPYASDENGCAALECITNGLRIRNAIMADGNEAKIAVSMKDMFDGLNAIHNIGLGIEDDPNRAGYELVRIEPVKYFFKTDLIMFCDHIKEVKREVDMTALFSTFKTGYAKWETESTNGLFDIFGNREYRTTLSQLRNELDRVSKLIASDYTIEVTRRQFGATTKDWRYDNDTFIICLKNLFTGSMEFIASLNLIRITGVLSPMDIGDSIQISGSGLNDGTYTISSFATDATYTYIVVAEPIVDEVVVCAIENLTTTNYTVEQGNITGDANILYPDYVMNYRISPVRNALRHLKTLLQSYRDYVNGKIKFTNGNGNITGEGLLTDGCIDEDAVIAENADLELGVLDSPDDNWPLYWPELVKYEYPVSYQEYLNIKLKKYSLMAFQCQDGDIELGWIEDFQYRPYEGKAEFTLRPAIITEELQEIIDNILSGGSIGEGP